MVLLWYRYMNYIEITSRNNEKIKYVNKLVKNSRERKENGLFVCEGLRLCRDAVLSGYEVREAYLTEAAIAKYGEKAQEIADCAERVYLITDEVADKLSDTVNSQGVFCVVKMKKQEENGIRYNNIYIALDNVQNPQNLGAAARTAEALGIDGVIVYSGCDRYNPKALRASMGSLLRVNMVETDDLVSLISEARENGMFTFVTVPDSDAQDVTSLSFDGGALAVIGNEGNGVSQEVQTAAQNRVTIKMKGSAESLNASAAAVITMWEMMR